MADPALIASAMDAFDDSIADIEEHVSALLNDEQSLDTLMAGMAPLERAKLGVMLSFSINTLFFLYMKTQGVSAKGHPLQKEMDRIKTYFQKIKHAEGTDKANMRLDKAAAGRFIKHALSAQKSAEQEEDQVDGDSVGDTEMSDAEEVAGGAASTESKSPSSSNEADGGKSSKKKRKEAAGQGAKKKTEEARGSGAAGGGARKVGNQGRGGKPKGNINNNRPKMDHFS
ncbi:hypothetical protein BJ742DRAFT_833854 [Cladochytrium replicatum]|nr:hypothetical protein BJ742DRAFT_833854 [Cladochytrium replicatum]